MSKYTTEVRFICESLSGLQASVGQVSVNDVIKKAAPLVFDFGFPIFDEEYRLELETKILKHYYTREIGLETYGLWKLKLDTKMNEIMPYYNQLYKSALLDFNPLYDTDLTRTFEESTENKRNKTENGTTSVDNTNYSLYSDTPQGGLSGVDAETYLTTATKITTDGNTTVNNSDEENGTGSRNYMEKVTGKQGGGLMSEAILKFRETFLNIDMQVITELSDLFMLIY